jgi:uncharacterized membrane protein YeaQ/YmgE (transglycosylase-associated protein family)
MGLCGWIVFGFLAGLVARAIVPGHQGLGCLATTLLGIGGAFTGGFLGALLTGGNWRGFEPSGFLGAVIGAIVLLAVGQAAFGGRRR